MNATYLEWYRLYTTIEVAIPILDCCGVFIEQDFRLAHNIYCYNYYYYYYSDHYHRNSSDQNFINQLLNNCNTQVIRNLYNILSASIDFDQSRLEGMLSIRNGYNQELDRLR